MNIFVIDECPLIAAEGLIDMHKNKMLLEYSQILGGALLANGYDNTDKQVNGLPKAHYKHPSVRSATRSYNVCEWIYFSAMRLCELYTERTGKVHASQSKIEAAGLLIGQYIPDDGKTIHDIDTACGALNAMRPTHSVIEVYRKFYIQDKIAFASWRNPDHRPDWFVSDNLEIKLAWQMIEGRNKSRKNKLTTDDLMNAYEAFKSTNR